MADEKRRPSEVDEESKEITLFTAEGQEGDEAVDILRDYELLSFAEIVESSETSPVLIAENTGRRRGLDEIEDFAYGFAAEHGILTSNELKGRYRKGRP